MNRNRIQVCHNRVIKEVMIIRYSKKLQKIYIKILHQSIYLKQLRTLKLRSEIFYHDLHTLVAKRHKY